ncbi:ABC transporter substrate-binding protein [Salibacterium aidingense]|uniref:ABC transporter substrate-binding protein n=1 Tax=Salibacterium aidingense TaxID=384933 RepID=UPI0003FE36DE|nr:ABC transporter substrate-binding protein [Salibacterium aidingense]
MKIRHLLASSTLFLLPLSACGSSDDGTSSSEEPTELVISTWGFAEDFFRKEVYAPFEEEHNVEIVLETGNNSERLNKIRQGNSSVDLIYLSDYYAQQGINDDLFAEINYDNIPNAEDIYDVAQAPLGEAYGPAYTISQLGIAYNPEETDVDITSWEDLWDPALEDSIAVPSITATAGPMLLDAASVVSGKDQFDEDEAFAQMQELNPNIVNEYSQTSAFVNMFTQGEIAAGPLMEMFVADLKEAVPEASFVSPEEGAYAVMNTVNITADSENKELAEEFINWHLSAEVQKASAAAKIDSPVNTTLDLSEEEAEGLTYGADTIENLRVLDIEMVNEQSEAWTDRWNRELTSN